MVAAAAPATAQELSVWLDASASRAQPPADASGDPTAYGLVGARLLAELDPVELALAGRAGQAFEGVSGGRWVQGELTARAGTRVGRAGLRFSLSGFGLRYSDPFSYTAGAVEAVPRLALATGRTVWLVEPRITAGGWSADTLEGTLWVAGGGVGAQRSVGPIDLLARVEALDVANGAAAGAFLGGAVGAAVSRGAWTVSAGVRAQETPLETELGGAASVEAEITPAVRLRLEVGRYLRDPLFGTPGAVGASTAISVRPVRLRIPAAAPVAAIGAPRDGGREVRFTLRAPDAEQVEVSGDFTGWEPTPMEQRGERWTLTRVLEPGLHHFGFLVDGEWAIPPDAPGRVDDGWGRINASVVIEP